MMMFTSDLHLGHENLRSQYRTQFASVEEMDQVLIDNINRKMKRNDVLYVLGDLSFRSKRPVEEYLKQIRPRLVLVMGNHDRDWLRHMTEEQKARYFEGIYDRHSVKKNGIELHLNHYPMLAWNRSQYFGESFSICGHIHGDRTERVASRLFDQVPGQFNAGVDVNGLEPVSFGELVQNNIDYYGLTFNDVQRQALEDAVRRMEG